MKLIIEPRFPSGYTWRLESLTGDEAEAVSRSQRGHAGFGIVLTGHEQQRAQARRVGRSVAQAIRTYAERIETESAEEEL